MTTRDLRRAAWEREGGRCAVSGQPLGDQDGQTWHLHHRRPKGMGGTSRADEDTLPNVIAVTPAAHRGIHAYPARSMPRGLLLSKAQPDPAACPVRLWRGWVFLAVEGGYLPIR